MANSRGRPTKLTPAVQNKIVTAISAGNYYEAACQYAGIDYATFRRWIEKGEDGKNKMYSDFCEAVKQAEAQAEVRIVAQWQSQIPQNWQAARDFLARRYPKRWMPREAVESTNEHIIKPVEVIEVVKTYDSNEDKINKKHNKNSQNE